MKILIDIKHPAHVYIFKNIIDEFKKRGHEVLITSRDKDLTLYLLDKFKIKHICLSKAGKGKFGMLWELFVRIIKTIKISLKFKPDVFLDEMGVSTSPVGWLLGIPSIVYDVTESAGASNFIGHHFSTILIIPRCYHKKLNRKTITFNGYQTLMYLHPKHFAPNPEILTKLNLKKNDIFTVMRFVSWGASHDFGHRGLSNETKIRAAQKFSKYGKVFISSEIELIDGLKPYQIKINPEDMHSLMAYATLVYGESATMASEASALGVHSIYLDDDGRGYTDEQEKLYHLVSNFTESVNDQKLSIQKGIKILKNPNSKKDGHKKLQKLLAESDDVVEFFINQVLQFDPKRQHK